MTRAASTTSSRLILIALLFALSFIMYLDRAAISSAKDLIASDLSLTNESMGLVFGAFALGYAIAQVPSGFFADRVGPRLALAAVVTAWSLFTSLTFTFIPQFLLITIYQQKGGAVGLTGVFWFALLRKASKTRTKSTFSGPPLRHTLAAYCQKGGITLL